MTDVEKTELKISSDGKNLFDKIYNEEMNPFIVALSATQSSIGIWDIDIVNNKGVWSNNLRDMLGLHPGTTEISTLKEYSRFIHPEDIGHFWAVIDGSMKRGESMQMEYRLIRPADKKIIWVENSGQIIFNEDNLPIRGMGTVTDITALKDAEFRAISADRSKSEFLANMSHEIRTPMNGIMGMAELLQNCELGPRETDFVNVINRSANALLTLINDILDFSKIESGHIELENTPFNLRDCIEDITSLLSPKVGESGIDLLLRIQPDLPRCYLGDPGRIRQILTNIVGNAVKFTSEGHVLIDVSGQVESETAKLTINVVDTGIGIAPEKLGLVFNKFNQADNSTTREYGGTGLGLTISKDLAELMGGSIEVESGIGEGSTFTVSINLPVQEDIVKPAPKSLNIRGSKILVIDDNEVNRDILKEQLAYWNCQCVAAPSAKVGLAVLDRAKQKNIKFDLIIVDYQMPGSTGEDFVRTLKAHSDHADIPAIMLSSVDRTELRDRMNGLSISAFLTKPARGSVLHNAITDAICGPVSKQAIDQSAAPQASKRSNESVDFNQVEVLIAEDNEVNQTYAGYVMEDLGLSYKIVPNGRLAVETWQLLSPKVILMDISMPEMNGYEATAAIRKLEAEHNLPRTPIIAVTAHAMKSDRDVCLENDMDDYLSKPLSMQHLKEKLGLWNVSLKESQKISA